MELLDLKSEMTIFNEAAWEFKAVEWLIVG